MENSPCEYCGIKNTCGKNEGVQQMEKVDAGRMGGNKKNLRRLHTRVTAQTYRKLEQWAIVEKCGTGRVVDKLVSDRMIELRRYQDG